ncbi:dinitrogenase iron-molybdenum cofactor biosynthesis protein [Shewanella sp. 4t3-1-2LB]|uniref:NifB/NifX family molybdenum-iron cluster-binding protein n=1 Tax=Shewanella sp. 4t3-1-2LB TaxID=2817682 RepID=UPI001A98125A|nr:NifB/NifX family molybdenum-iron cluster-binding protein [Shewanella sp. 4t3-1-2LB]MBO1270901.1 dinitrogenase iron-molybdenum cofactor biosynthesis protein [Shewanella sp. 4t3-1-2LB]
MIVIPMSRGHLSGHFTKAQQLAFFSADGQLQQLVDNPALGGNCADKSAMLNLIKQQGAQIVLVHQIGERMLGKLLDAGISVCRPRERNGSLQQLLNDACDTRLRLLDTSTARPSLQHQNKGGCGESCGCGGSGGCHHHASTVPQSSLCRPQHCCSDEIHFSGFRPQK